MIRVALILTAFIFLSCGNNKSVKEESSKDSKNIQNESVEDTAMTPEEIFSSSLVQDILGEDEDIDLQFYLEEEIYPQVSSAEKITLDRISSSLYLLSYREKGTEKNFVLKKYYDPVSSEIKFDKTETQFNPEKQFLK
ncbi:MAG: hypothetical protein JSS91_11560 [Bacteroidetes bacterium]|nr:hypothetical protein [Bacteroidota bacterium]